MISEINNELNKRKEMDTGEELRYLARSSANTRTNKPGFLEHAYYHFLQQSKNEAHSTRFSEIMDASSKKGKIVKP